MTVHEGKKGRPLSVRSSLLVGLGCLVGCGLFSGQRRSNTPEPPKESALQSAPNKQTTQRQPHQEPARKPATLPKKQGQPTVAILPLGKPFPQQRRRQVQNVLGSLAKLVWLPAHPLPRSAFSKRYKRYRADRLCSYLATHKPKRADYIVGLTQVDISSSLPDYLDHAVFGLSDTGGPAAVLSTYRLANLKLSAQRTDRAWKSLVLHEWGHLLRLPHCATLACAMRDAHPYVHRLRFIRPAFCSLCTQRLHRTKKSLDSKPQNR
ncbi:MAG: hypothetical protein EP343_16310 [Deltaproteobacteria bacterium]|nr:MAG: hypothetical protein EP343_16310 [Deltaproteobacteria bacterium]